jgi:hypothetical protein
MFCVGIVHSELEKRKKGLEAELASVQDLLDELNKRPALPGATPVDRGGMMGIVTRAGGWGCCYNACCLWVSFPPCFP